MPRVPSYNQQRLPSTNIGAAPIQPASSGAGAIGQGIANLGQSVSGLGEQLYQIEEKKRKLEDTNSELEAKKIYETANIEYENFKASNPRDQWVGFRQKQVRDYSNKTRALKWSPEAAKKNETYARYWSGISIVSSETDSTVQLVKDTREAVEFDFFKSVGTPNEQESEKRMRDALAETGMDATEIEKRVYEQRAKGTIKFEKKQYDAERQKMSQFKIAARQDGLTEFEQGAILDEARKYAQSSTILDPDQVNAELQNIDMLQASLKRRDEADARQHDIDVVVDFSDRLETKDKEQMLDMDMVREEYPSSAKTGTEADKIKFWQYIIEGKNRPAPTETDRTGAVNTLDILDRYRTRTTDKVTALQDLMRLRYQDPSTRKLQGSITDQTYLLAKKRIINNYDPHNSSAIDDALALRENAIFSGERVWYKAEGFEKKATQKKLETESIKLYKYVDDVLKKDPKHIFEPSELNNIFGQIQATTPKSFGPTAPVYQQSVPREDIDTEPQTKAEFIQNIQVLKSLNYEQALEYDAKWRKKWQ